MRKESVRRSSSNQVRYGECQKNHAANIGGYAVDGCREFMAGGAEGTAAALSCAACGCHRNFHRREVDREDSSSPSWSIILIFKIQENQPALIKRSVFFFPSKNILETGIVVIIQFYSEIWPIKYLIKVNSLKLSFNLFNSNQCYHKEIQKFKLWFIQFSVYFSCKSIVLFIYLSVFY